MDSGHNRMQSEHQPAGGQTRSIRKLRGSESSWSKSEPVGMGEAGGGATIDARYVPAGERVASSAEIGRTGNDTGSSNTRLGRRRRWCPQ